MAAAAPRWGYHQLAPEAARRLVADAQLPPGALVLDIGAGSGALTAPLVDAGAQVIAIELHRARAAQLSRRFQHRGVTVATVDASDLRLPRRPFHVVANPPYGITTSLLRRLLHPGSRLLSARLVLPDWAVRRWTAPAAPGWARWSATFDVERGQVLRRRQFRPAAPTDARVLVIARR